MCFQKARELVLQLMEQKELEVWCYIQYESKKRFHYRAVPFQRTVITDTVRLVFSGGTVRFCLVYRSVPFRLCALAVPAEIVKRTSD